MRLTQYLKAPFWDARRMNFLITCNRRKITQRWSQWESEIKDIGQQIAPYHVVQLGKSVSLGHTGCVIHDKPKAEVFQLLNYQAETGVNGIISWHDTHTTALLCTSFTALNRNASNSEWDVGILRYVGLKCKDHKRMVSDAYAIRTNQIWSQNSSCCCEENVI